MLDVMRVYLATVADTGAEPPSLLEMIVQAEPIVQAVLYLLIGMSIACWAIILNKTRVVRRAARQNESFLDLFWKLRRPDQVYEQIHEYLHAPIGQVFKAGYVELSRLASAAGSEASRGGAMDLGGTENIARAMRRAASVQITALERMIPFLATTGATAPFIGLFGTVWGILRAFQRIGASGQASIQVVGPDIAHALVATAMGLLAAIPAVMAYNFFHSKIRVISTELDNFSADFMNIVKRHFRGA